MAYVPVPKDLTRVKTKVMFNLTKRQLICFGAGVLIGAPLFFLLLRPLGSSTAALLIGYPVAYMISRETARFQRIAMMLVMLPFFLLGVYEKNGQPLEKVAGNIIRASILRPRQRPYRTNNFYALLERQDKLDKEVSRIVHGQPSTSAR